MKFVALVPQRELNAQTLLGDVLKLPTLEEGVEQLVAQTVQEHHVDLPIEFSSLCMSEDGALFMAADVPAGELAFQYTRHALSQAVVRIKPEGVVGMAGYLAACPPDLRADNFNFWHTEFYGSEAKNITRNDVTLRTRAGESSEAVIRAVVSQSYVPIDDLPLVKQFKDIAPAGSKIRSVRGDVKSRYDIIWPTHKKALVTGEPLMVAVRLSNSEAGTSSVRLEPMVHAFGRCSSIIVPTITADVSIRHIGEAGKKLVKRLDNVMMMIDPFMEMLNASYSDAILAHFNSLDQMNECMKKAFEFNDPTMARIKDSLFRKETRADLIEAIARAADDLPIEDGEYLQRCAGMLTMKGFRLLTKFATSEE